MFLRPGPLWVALSLVCAFAGCDAIKSIGEEDESTEEEVADSGYQPPPEGGSYAGDEEVEENSPPVVDQEVPMPPTPEEVLADFMARMSNQRTDLDLEKLAQSPELLAGITELDLSDGQVTDFGLRHLALFPDLERLDLSATRVTNEGLSQLTSCPKLIAVHLNQLRSVDEIGVRELAVLPIQELSLRNTSVTEGLFAVLAEFDALHTLYIDGNANINGQHFRGLVDEFSQWKLLSASGTAIGFGLQTIGELSELEVVRISSTETTNDAMEQLARCRKLVELDVSGNLLTDECAPFLARMGEVKILSLRGCAGLTDQIIDELGRLEQLERLDLTGTSCTAAGAQSLKERLQNTVIVFDDEEL